MLRYTGSSRLFFPRDPVYPGGICVSDAVRRMADSLVPQTQTKIGSIEMIRSMTGYASICTKVDSGQIQCEMKSLNHRGFDIHYHSSRALAMLDVPTRDTVGKQIKRGRVEIYLKGELKMQDEFLVSSKPEVAARYLEAIRGIQEQFPKLRPVRLEFLLNLPGVFEVQEPVLSPDDLWGAVHKIVERALSDLVAMKRREGENLAAELNKILTKIEHVTREISGAREQVLEEFRNKMTERIAEWVQKIDIDESRVIQEIAYYADRSDIREECVRLLSHVDQFREILEENSVETDAYKAVGRRLDFLCQEMFREANTMGAKSSSMEVVQRVLRLKGQIDRLREQVQNVE